MAQDHIRKQLQQNEASTDAVSSQPWDRVHTFKIIASLCIGNWILQHWHSQTYADALIHCLALITGRRGRNMHKNEVFVAEVLGEWLFQQQSPARGSHHQKDPTFPKTLKPRSQQDIWQWEDGHRETQASPPHNSSLEDSQASLWEEGVGEGDEVARTWSSRAKSLPWCHPLVCAAMYWLAQQPPHFVCVAFTISLFRLKSHHGI